MHLGLFDGREVGEVFFQQFFQLLRSLFPSVLVSHVHTQLTAGFELRCNSTLPPPSLSKIDGGVNCRKARSASTERNPFRRNFIGPL